MRGDIFSRKYLNFRIKYCSPFNFHGLQKRTDVNEGNLNSAGKKGTCIKREGFF